MFQSQPIDKNDKKLEQQQQIMDIKQLQQLVIDKPSFINDIISDITLLEESIQLINAKPYKNEQDNILLRDYISKLDKAKNLYVNSVMLNPKLYDIPEINHSLSTIDNTQLYDLNDVTADEIKQLNDIIVNKPKNTDMI